MYKPDMTIKTVPTSGTYLSCISCPKHLWTVDMQKQQGLYTRNINKKEYELKDHLGNVRITVGDQKYADSTVQIKTYTSYYAFGMQMVGTGKNYVSAGGLYRYGFNGMEKDDEVKGSSGTSYTTEFRQNDPRIGRWMSIDPKAIPWESPYASMGNNPILYNDIKGDTIKIGSGGAFDKGKYAGAFKDATTQALNKLQETKEGKALYDKLQNSKNVFTINYGEESGATPLDFDAAKGKTKGGSGGIISFNPNERLDKTANTNEEKSDYIPSFINLGHELLGHGTQYNEGSLDRSPVTMKFGSKIYSMKYSEIDASHTENILRTGHGLPLRITYGGFPVVTGTTYVLDSSFDYKKKVLYDSGKRPGGGISK
jgi:RHS repeat-associated protein